MASGELMYLLRYLHSHGFCSLSLAQHAADGAWPQMTGAHGRSATGSHPGGTVLDSRHTTVQGEATTTANRMSIA
jgi:hypothetical protein